MAGIDTDLLVAMLRNHFEFNRPAQPQPDTGKRIVYTRPENLVSVVVPSSRFIRSIMEGTALQQIADRMEPPCKDLRGLANYLQANEPLRLIKAGVKPVMAYQYVHRLINGGASETEAYKLLMAKDAEPYGTGVELWPVSKISGDRWFRDAWRRREEGGDIWVDLTVAKQIHARRLRILVDDHNTLELETDKNRRAAGIPTNGPALLTFDNDLINLISAVTTIEDLRAIWPEGLPQLMESFNESYRLQER